MNFADFRLEVSQNNLSEFVFEKIIAKKTDNLVKVDEENIIHSKFWAKNGPINAFFSGQIENVANLNCVKDFTYSRSACQ